MARTKSRRRVSRRGRISRRGYRFSVEETHMQKVRKSLGEAYKSGKKAIQGRIGIEKSVDQSVARATALRKAADEAVKVALTKMENACNPVAPFNISKKLLDSKDPNKGTRCSSYNQRLNEIRCGTFPVSSEYGRRRLRTKRCRAKTSSGCWCKNKTRSKYCCKHRTSKHKSSFGRKVHRSKAGGRYVIRVSKNTGKRYRQYI